MVWGMETITQQATYRLLRNVTFMLQNTLIVPKEIKSPELQRLIYKRGQTWDFCPLFCLYGKCTEILTLAQTKAQKKRPAMQYFSTNAKNRQCKMAKERVEDARFTLVSTGKALK